VTTCRPQHQLAGGLARFQQAVCFSHVGQGKQRTSGTRSLPDSIQAVRSLTASCSRSVREKRNDRLKATTLLFSVVIDRGLKRGIVRSPRAALR